MSRGAQIRFLSRVARFYDLFVTMMGFPSLWRAMAEVAAPQVGEQALDVCTGTGGVALELARQGAHVVGLDLARGMLARASAKRNGTRFPLLVQMDARWLAFSNRAFSLVTCSMALHEMAEIERAQVLDEIVRVARDRIVIAEYRVPLEPRRRLLFRAAHCFEYLESDDFERFVQHDFGARLTAAGLAPDPPIDVGGYRVWPCRVRQS